MSGRSLAGNLPSHPAVQGRDVKRLPALALAVALCVTLPACARGTGGGQPTTGVQGSATIGPMCPVLTQGTPCPDRPVPGATIQIRNASNTVVASGTSNAEGRFRIAVAPGHYTVYGKNPSGFQKASAPVTVTVPSGGFASITVTFDSGIR